jgi:ribosome maturation factor RimP
MPSWPISDIARLLEPTLSHMGYDVYSIEQTGGGGRTLRVVIDKREGFVSLDDCTRVSRVASPLLDQADLIPDSYMLEVSSPGAERDLRGRREYERFAGKTVNVHYRAGEAEAVVEGKLETIDDTGISIRGQRDLVTRVEWDNVIRGRLVATL